LGRLRLWLLDVAAEAENGKPMVWLWCKSGDGGVYVVKQRYKPSFYILPGEQAEGVVEALKSAGAEHERCARKLRGKPVEALRVYADVEDLEDYASKLAKKLGEVELYEEDLRLSAKYLLESDLRPCSWLEVKGEPAEREGISFIEPREVKGLGHGPPPSLLVMLTLFTLLSAVPRGPREIPLDSSRLRSVMACGSN